MQPPVRQGPSGSALNSMRVPGAAPCGPLRPPVLPGQRQGPVVNATSRGPAGIVPPTVFRFQALGKSKNSTKPLNAHVPYANLKRHRAIPREIPREPPRETTMAVPSTSFSSMNFAAPNNLTSFPVFESATDVYVNAASGQVEKVGLDEHGNEIELEPNCKLFNYKCRVEGVDRTLLVPMPMDATEEDVMKILPESFSQFATMLKQNPPPPPPPPRQKVTVTPKPKQAESAPYLVNEKQYTRIQHRRVMRQRLEMSGRLPMQRQKYLHESRHLHAINRRRGHDGRFDPKLRPEEGEGPSTSDASSSRQVAQPLSRPVTTYAEIRPAQPLNGPPMYYGPSRIRVINQPVTNPPANLTPVTFASSVPSTSSAPTTSFHDFHDEPITSYHQYQQHVQYPDLYDHEGDREDLDRDPQQKFTDL
uniref:Nuclear transcription factor Y subunit n=1 Tax=Caenorhabditis japonica TaxID=281687 RepID=A0A8R1DSL2_CAEJA